MVSGTASVFLLPMYFRGPGGGVGEAPRAAGVLVCLSLSFGPPLLGDVSTKTAATAATITPAVPMASQADWRFLRGRRAGPPVPRGLAARGAAGTCSLWTSSR